MFDVAWSEILVVLVVAVVLISPKDLPLLIKFVKEMRTKIIIIKSNFSHLWQQLVEESDLKQSKESLDSEIERLNRHLAETLSKYSVSELAGDVADKQAKALELAKKVEQQGKETIH